MLAPMLTEDRLREILGRVPGATQVIVGRRGSKLVAIVVSPEYADIPEVERQSQAWGLVLDNLSDAEAAQVSFVYTNTPEEKAQAEIDAAAGRAAD